jgi:hypothetical protein
VAVGNHTLEIIGVNGYALCYNFTVTPIGVDNYNDQVFYKYVKVDAIENAMLYLDGEPYNKEIIRSLGYHTIKIEGSNGYEQSFNFTITEDPILKDVNGYRDFEDGFVAEYMINLTIPNSDVFIDDEPYTSGTNYYTVGLHYLRIVGDNGYEKEYTFVLKERVNGLVNGQEYLDLKLDCPNTQELYLNGTKIENLAEVNIVGRYTFVVKGTNGYSNEYNFIIKMDLKNVANDGIYDSAVSPIANAKNLFLNDERFVSGTAISDIGYYRLRIEGVGGYKQEISFVVEPRIEGVEHYQTYKTSISPTINSKNMLLNGKAYISGTTISTVGNYTLVIYGANGYEKEIVFTIEDNLL